MTKNLKPLALAGFLIAFICLCGACIYDYVKEIL